MESRELNLVKKWIRVYKISNDMKILSNLGQFGDDEFSGQIFSLRQYEANYCLWIDLTYLTLCRSLSQLGLHDHEQEILCEALLADLAVKASFEMMQGVNEPSVIWSA